MENEIRPGKGYYSIGVIIIIIGIIGFCINLYLAISGFMYGDNLVTTPGSDIIELTEAGTYTIFHEYKSTVQNSISISYKSDLDGLSIEVYDFITKVPFEVMPSKMNSTYTIGSRSGESIFEFEILEPTTVEVVTSFKNDEKEIVLNIQKNNVLQFLFKMLLAFASIGISVIIAIISFIIISSKRKRFIKENEIDRQTYYMRDEDDY